MVEAVAEEVRKDLFFRDALEIGRVPSSARLRQRYPCMNGLLR